MLQLFPYGKFQCAGGLVCIESEVVLEGYNDNYQDQGGQIRNSSASCPFNVLVAQKPK